MQEKMYDAWAKKMKEIGKAKRIPVCGQFELTPRCNFDCKMCYIHNQDSNKYKDRELTTEQFKRIFDEAYDSGMMFVSLTGGECLLREDFKELYLHLWNKRMRITVLTNGFLIDDTYIEFFKQHMPDKIQITLYGSSEENYLNVTGHHGFKRVTENIRKLIAAGIRVKVTVTPSKYSVDDYVATVKYIKDNHFNLGLAEMTLAPKRDTPEDDAHCLSCDEIVQLCVQRAQLFRKVELVANTPEPWGDCKQAPKKGSRCNAGNGTAHVLWDGTMQPCSMMMIDQGVSLREMSFADAWEKTKAAADQVVYGIECEGCPYDALCPKCPQMRLLDLKSGHCNPAVCEITRKLVAAGVKSFNHAEQMDE